VAAPKPASRFDLRQSLFHPANRNPATAYRLVERRAEGELWLETREEALEIDGVSAAETGRGLGAAAAVSFVDPELDTRVGLAVEHVALRGDGNVTTTGGDGDGEGPARRSDTVVTPFFAWPMGPHFYGALAYDVGHAARSGGFYGAHHNIAFAQPRLAAVYQLGDDELGLAYEAKVDEHSRLGAGDNDNGSDNGRTVRVAKPPRLIASVARRLHDPLGTSFIYGNVAAAQNAALNSDGESGWRNSLAAAVGLAKLLHDNARFDVTLALQLPAYRGAGARTPERIRTLALTGRYAKPLDERTDGGFGLVYVLGKDGGTKRSELRLLLDATRAF
jgi:hypothetical protein